MPVIDFYPLLTADERRLPKADKEHLRGLRKPLKRQLKRGELTKADLDPEHHAWWDELEDDIDDRRAIKGKVFGFLLEKVEDLLENAIDEAFDDADE